MGTIKGDKVKSMIKAICTSIKIGENAISQSHRLEVIKDAQRTE